MIYLYYGDNSFLIQEKLSAIRAKYESKFSSGLNFWKFDLESDCSELKSALGSQSMFDEKKLIFLRGVFSVPESSWEEIKNEAGKILKSNEVIAVFYQFGPAQDAADKKRLEFFQKNGKTEEFKNFERNRFINWILEKSKSVGLKMGYAESVYLADNIGLDPQRASSEISKLASYKNGDILTKKDIDAVVPFETYSNNFKAIDALLNKNAVLAIKGLEEQWAKNEDPIKILGALVWQFRILLKLTDLKYSSLDEASKKLGAPAWSVKKSVSALRNFSATELKNIYQKLADADLAIKTGVEDGREVLSDFVCSL